MLTFRGNHGSIEVDPATGNVTDYENATHYSGQGCICGEARCSGYLDIARVEVAEWRAWRGGVLGLDSSDDILAAGYWTHAMVYCEPEQDWREDAEISRGKRPVPPGHWSLR